MIPPIELANLNPGAVPVAEGMNDTFVGTVTAESGEHKAYVKIMSGRQLVNELLATTLGRALGLPVPPGLLVRVRPDDLPENAYPQGAGPELLTFASRAMEYPTLGKRVSVDMILLREYHSGVFKRCDEIAAFDEWVANVDRHTGNLLLAPGNVLWMIDHGHCFTGADWTRENLQPDLAYPNRMVDEMVAHLDSQEKSMFYRTAKSMEPLCGAVDCGEALTQSQAAGWLAAEDIQALIQFLQERVAHLQVLIGQRFGFNVQRVMPL